MLKPMPRIRKSKVRRRLQAGAREKTNPSDLDPSIELSGEHEKASSLFGSLTPRTGAAKISSKKAKRLKKYIGTKLRKDESRKLIAKLVQNRADTSRLTSSRSLGSGRQNLNKDRRPRPIHARTNSETEESTSEETDEDIVSKTTGRDSGANPNTSNLVGLTTKLEARDASTPILKRALEFDGAGLPLLPVLKRRKKIARRPALTMTQPLDDTDMSSDSEGPPEVTFDDLEDASNSETDEDSESASEDSNQSDDGASRTLAFKTWASSAINEALEYKPAPLIMRSGPILKPNPLRDVSPEQADITMSMLNSTMDTKLNRTVSSVLVDRTDDLQAARMALPILAEEQNIMEKIHNNSAVIVCGATGSGKTTQVPQFLFEAGYGRPNGPNPGMIGVTQPRRVAAISMARRVSTELGQYSDKVAYQVRFEGNTSRDSSIKFMTEGVLLREASNDILLRRYSAIIIDEAHERSINTDILIGMMSRILRLREELSLEDKTIKPLKLVIMSATLRVSDFARNATLFSPEPPILDIEGSQHPITMHFSKRTNIEYVDEAFQKICKAHKQLPNGGFLVFLTSQNDIEVLSGRLEEAINKEPRSSVGNKPTAKASGRDGPLEVEDIDFGIDIDLDDHSNDMLTQSESESESEFGPTELSPHKSGGPKKLNADILPLYSLLPMTEQMRVFEPVPSGTRLIVLATNVAETSLTIPGISYVFDCGRAKKRKYHDDIGVQSYEVEWISKASAQQRAGRAGRTGPGHCYRLYSSAVYERDFAEFDDPEILRSPIDGIVLQLKSMSIENILNFPFPSPPKRSGLAAAEKLLSYLEATDIGSRVTPLGKTMSIFPLSPRFSKIVTVGNQHGCLPYIIAVVATLSVGEIFISAGNLHSDDAAHDSVDDDGAGKRRSIRQAHQQFTSLDSFSDAIRLLAVICAYEHEADKSTFAKTHYLHAKAVNDALLLRRQLTEIVRVFFPGTTGPVDPKLTPPSKIQIRAIRQILAAGFLDRLAIRADLHPSPPQGLRMSKSGRSSQIPYLPLIPTGGPTPGSDAAVDIPAYIHLSSVLASRESASMPAYLVYTHLQTPAAALPGRPPRMRMYPLTDLTGKELASLAKGSPLISYGKPLSVEPIIDLGGGRRECWVIPYLGAAESSGGFGWPLPATKVTQKKGPRGVWLVE